MARFFFASLPGNCLVYLCRAPPSGRNRDFTISGLLTRSNSPEMVSPSPSSLSNPSSLFSHSLSSSPSLPPLSHPSLPLSSLLFFHSPFLPSIASTHFLNFVAPNPASLFTPSVSSSPIPSPCVRRTPFRRVIRVSLKDFDAAATQETAVDAGNVTGGGDSRATMNMLYICLAIANCRKWF